MNPTVFLSHSAKEPATRALLVELVAALKDEGFDPFVDYEGLRNGQLWWPELQKRVRAAHAVIVLVSPSALGSVPVLQEVTLAMADRRDIRGLDRVFALFTPEVSYEAVEKSPLGMTGLQAVHSERLDDLASVRPIVSAMLADIHQAYSARPTSLLEAALEGWLVTAGGASLVAAAHVLGVSPVESGLPTRIAQRLLEYTGDSVRGVRAVEEFLEVVPPTGQREQLVELILAAASLPDTVRGQVEAVLGGQERVVGVAVDKVRTGSMYLRRACLSWRPWTTHVADAVQSAGYLESLIDGVRRHLLEVLCFGDDEPTEDELLDELRDYERRYGPVTVTVPAAPDPQALRQLRGRFPLVLFVFVAGSAAQPVHGVRWLDPALAQRVERMFGQVWYRHELVAAR